MARILVVDDEPAIRQTLTFTLGSEGHHCFEAADADEASNICATSQLDLILLDWMLPGISGVDFARRLKRDPGTRHIPLIMVSAKGEETDKVQALDTGADDYITKPFSTKELLARIRAVIRRRASSDAEQEVVELGGVRIDTQTHRVTIDQQIVDLSPTEFKLLHFLAVNAERVRTRGQILDGIWGNDVYLDERTVDVHIRRLRKFLEPHGRHKFVQTVRGVGYRFSEK
ncbi:MAG TPA: phosphate regulon transcriptional regulatory protein PhoB [Gammaproteobacteria bacterium]|nr:phosphate regulon transcriptional regulatory protein PhoB [Gammaproteobacteria bacterium]|tara:strand:- start:1629 stop:2315 length:687 start_codon:yes stop_codon:yes gene_type:complete